VLSDVSAILAANDWAKRAIAQYKTLGADRIIGEANNGGDLIEAVLRAVDPNISYKKVIASRGKTKRAEPVAALYEQGRIHHVGAFAKLEDEMCEFDPAVGESDGQSPNRMDSLVWGFTELFNLSEESELGLLEYYRREAARAKEKESA
jgi:phage terminase large subunit-like protein